MDKNIQLKFLNMVKELAPSNRSLHLELSDLLGISIDSVYRRMRGETVLGLDEAVKICNNYGLSLDVFTKGDASFIPFRFGNYGREENSTLNYLKKVEEDLTLIQGVSNKEIVYAAEDIPIFYYFQFPVLTAFKIFYWNRSILNVSSLENKKFVPSLISDEIISISRHIFDLYITIPTVEIWTENTGNSMFKQIEFYWESGLFMNKKDALTVCSQLKSMFLHLEKQAQGNSKIITDLRHKKNEGDKTNFILYNSDVMMGNNCIQVTIGDKKISFLSNLTFTSIATTNPGYCQETEAWLQNLIQKSILISGVAEKQRLRFFANLHSKLERLRDNVLEGDTYKQTV